MPRLKAFLGVAVIYLLIAGLLLGATGLPTLPACWIYLGVMAVVIVVTYVAVYDRVPEMMQEQHRSNAGEHDTLTRPLFGILLAAHWIIAGLDVGRYHWTDNVPLLLQLSGLILFGCGFSLLAWSITINRFYSPRVNIQKERAQEVITTGPYRFVRHPGYSGWLLFMLFSGLALGSWLAMLPMLVLVTLIVRRTIIEDKMLHDHLSGYAAYADSVHYRLVPGVW